MLAERRVSGWSSRGTRRRWGVMFIGGALRRSSTNPSSGTRSACHIGTGSRLHLRFTPVTAAEAPEHCATGTHATTNHITSCHRTSRSRPHRACIVDHHEMHWLAKLRILSIGLSINSCPMGTFGGSAAQPWQAKYPVVLLLSGELRTTDQKVGSSSLSGRAKSIVYTASDQRRSNSRRSN